MWLQIFFYEVPFNLMLDGNFEHFFEKKVKKPFKKSFFLTIYDKFKIFFLEI